MVLARLAKSIRRQDWTTFTVEFVLVITGVLVALEVDNWNQQRVAEREFRRDLALLQTELRENRERLAYTIERLEDDLAVLTAFQRAFHAETSVSHGEQSEAFVSALMHGYVQLIRGDGVDRLLRSDGILDESFESLRRDLEAWNRTFNGYVRIWGAQMRYQNDVILPLFTDKHSQVARAEYMLRDTPYRIDASGRHDELRDVLADPRVENAVVITLLTQKEVLDHASYLDQVSEQAIAEIDRLLGASPR